MLSFLVTSLAATALIAWVASACAGLSLVLPERLSLRFSPAARARSLLALCVLPASSCLVVMSAALAPWLGVIADHCLSVPDLHEHPHICGHHVAELPSVSLLVLAALLVLRMGYGVLRSLLSLVSLVLTERRLLAISRAERHGGELLRVLPIGAPQAFVLGVMRPTLYVTSGLLAAEHREHLSAVLAHERAHARRFDALRLFVANLALSLHLPAVATKLRARLASAQEMAADAEAAIRLGSRERVARALLCLLRAQRRVPARAPAAALAFGQSDVEARVQLLLEARAQREWPSSIVLWLILATAGALVALHAGAVHHAVEHTLGFLG
jgi:Zn-dependent protease with chaperone function